MIDNLNEFYEKVAFDMPIDERLEFIKTIPNKSCLNCVSPICRVEHHEKVGLDKDGLPQGQECYGWENFAYVGKYKILKRGK